MGTLRLLLVDDDDVDRERMRRQLAKGTLETEVVEGASAEEALSLASSQEFDLILLDYHLGCTTGLELLPRLKAACSIQTPVIMVTGLGDERLAVQAMREGAYDYFSKGRVDPQSLTASIKASLRRAELERSLSAAQSRLERLSFFDDLTGLANRRQFIRRLDEAISAQEQGGRAFSVMMMDLNLFKSVNDSLGHFAGDAVLKEVGRRLSGVGRDADTVARFGGDEFAALFLGADSVETAELLAGRIHDVMQPSMVVQGQTINIGISIGVAMFPAHASARIDILAVADEAMYRAKRSSRGFWIYDHSLRRTVGRSVWISSLLPTAISSGELEMHYQPKVDLVSGTVCSFEALVRWQSPALGWVSPGEFVPIAERSGLIESLTWRTLEIALEAASRWHQAGWELPVQVNLSVLLLAEETLIDRVMLALERWGLPTKALVLEITETALLEQPEEVRGTTSRLVDLGVGISIDDFGAGFTSFSFLRHLAITELKIDRLFLSETPLSHRDVSILRSVAALGAGFGTTVTAEGIEDTGVIGDLVDVGIHMGQGYGIARPMPIHDVIPWLTQRGAAKEGASGERELEAG